MWAHILLGYLRTLRVRGRHPSCRHLSQLLSLWLWRCRYGA